MATITTTRPSSSLWRSNETTAGDNLWGPFETLWNAHGFSRAFPPFQRGVFTYMTRGEACVAHALPRFYLDGSCGCGGCGCGGGGGSGSGSGSGSGNGSRSRMQASRTRIVKADSVRKAEVRRSHLKQHQEEVAKDQQLAVRVGSA
mmetsp:Transcript_24959/g.71851  ORF Transcript_24959/g.71851 Transcript_24959/m.71851 type:complete len:146 (-) Transcript_24959:141-578(-)